MRLPCLLVALASSACALASSPAAQPPPASMRERLAAPARLLVAADESGGTLTAERKAAGAWEGGMLDLPIANGELVVSADDTRSLTLEAFQLTLAPLAVPDGVFGAQVARLEDVQLELVRPITVPATWTGDDEARADVALELTLDWTLVLDGSPAPLGSPDLPPVPVSLLLTGDGPNAHAELRLRADGELWSWFGAVRLRDLALVLAADLHE